MLTVQDIGNEVVYEAALKEVKKSLSFGKKLFKKDFSKEEASKVELLWIKDTELENLDFLHFFPNLKDLDFENCLVENFDGLQYCRNLTGFNYRLDEEHKDYGRKDFSFLQYLPELEEVSVAGNQVEDVSMFVGLNKLEDLALTDNPIKTIAPLKALPKLSCLEIQCCGRTSFDDLEEFKAMKIIFAAGNLESEEQMREYQEKYPHIAFDYELY